jgi:hypothetical protein
LANGGLRGSYAARPNRRRRALTCTSRFFYIPIFFKGARPKSFDKTPLMVPSKHAGKVYAGTDRLTSGGFKKIEPKAVNPMKCRGTVWPYATSNSEGNRLNRKNMQPSSPSDWRENQQPKRSQLSDGSH